MSAQGRRLSSRAAQWRFAWWQEKGFDRRYNFDALRHSAVANVYRASKDLFLAQRFARHASLLTTIIYTHPVDEESLGGREGLALLKVELRLTRHPPLSPRRSRMPGVKISMDGKGRWKPIAHLDSIVEM